jgi:hypothetical protein
MNGARTLVQCLEGFGFVKNFLQEATEVEEGEGIACLFFLEAYLRRA